MEPITSVQSPGHISVDKMTMEVFKKKIQGRIIVPEDADYHSIRKVYNGMIDKYPAMIVQCNDVEDIIACVNFARDNQTLLAIRGGGHNAGGLGICDGGLVIDLSRLKKIQVNNNDKTVWVQGGCLLKELDAATHAYGMAVPSGIFGSTGVSGLTLGGGLGHLTRQYGLSIDNLLEVEIVLADGSFVKASGETNPDLFWALRGGGGNFGVVVSFLFKLSPVHTIYGGPMLWEMNESDEMIQWYHNYIKTAPDEINGFFAYLTVPTVQPFPEHLHMKKMCGIVWCYNGDPDKAEEIFQPIRSFKKPALDFVNFMPFTALQTMFDPIYPPGLLWYWKADFVNELNEESIKLHTRFGNEMPTSLSSMHMYPVNGAASRIGKNDTAWNYRDANYSVVIVGIDDNPGGKEKIIHWAKDYWNALHPYSAGGAYINFMMDEGEERIKATYGDNYNKIAKIKSKYDPENIFRVNQNIKPG